MANGVGVSDPHAAGSQDTEQYELLHLSRAYLCPSCGKEQCHFWLCPICGKLIPAECGCDGAKEGWYLSEMCPAGQSSTKRAKRKLGSKKC